MATPQVCADVYVGLTAGPYPGLEVAPDGRFTMLVSIPENVSHHFRSLGPRPTQTLEHDLANTDEQSHVMLPIRVSAARLSAVGGYFADVVATPPDGSTTEGEAQWPMHHQILDLRNRDGLACLLMLIAVHKRLDLLPKHVKPSLLAHVANNAYAHRSADAITPLCSPWIDMCLAIQVIPSKLCKELDVWIMIKWVFRHQGCFARATGTWIVSATHTATPFHPGMPEIIYTRIDMRREAHLKYYLNRLHTFHGCLATEGCIAANEADADRKTECAESVLSSLTTQMEQAGFLSPRPVAPFRRFSLRNLFNFIDSKDSPAIEGHPHCLLGPRLASLFHEVRLFHLKRQRTS